MKSYINGIQIQNTLNDARLILYIDGEQIAEFIMTQSVLKTLAARMQEDIEELEKKYKWTVLTVDDLDALAAEEESRTENSPRQKRIERMLNDYPPSYEDEPDA